MTLYDCPDGDDGETFFVGSAATPFVDLLCGAGGDPITLLNSNKVGLLSNYANSGLVTVGAVAINHPETGGDGGSGRLASEASRPRDLFLGLLRRLDGGDGKWAVADGEA